MGGGVFKVSQFEHQHSLKKLTAAELEGGLLSRPRPGSYASVTVPTGHWHTWVLFKFTNLMMEGWKREIS